MPITNTHFSLFIFLFHCQSRDALTSYDSFDFSHRDADTDSVNTMVVHEDEGEAGEGEQAGGYGDQTMLVQRVSYLCINYA